MKFIDQVRILAKSNITWNHGRILLGLGLEEINYATFGIPVEDLRVALWNDPTSSRRGLGRPSSMEDGMLKFNPTTVMYSTISKFCTMKQRIQRLAILEWGLMNPEEISYFFDRMKSDARFRNYYHSVYDALGVLYRRICNKPSDVVIQANRFWCSKIEVALDEERHALERCQEEIIARQARVSSLENIQADEFGDRYLWRQNLPPLPSWKSKKDKHAAKRKAAKLQSNLCKSKKLKVDDLQNGNPASDSRTVRLVEYSDDEEPTRRVVFHSEDETIKISAEGSGPAPATPELDSAMGARRRIVPSSEDNRDTEVFNQGRFASSSKRATEGSGSSPATLELDSTLGVRS